MNKHVYHFNATWSTKHSRYEADGVIETDYKINSFDKYCCLKELIKDKFKIQVEPEQIKIKSLSRL